MKNGLTIFSKIRKFRKMYCQIFLKIENFRNFANKFSKNQKIKKNVCQIYQKIEKF